MTASVAVDAIEGGQDFAADVEDLLGFGLSQKPFEDARRVAVGAGVFSEVAVGAGRTGRHYVRRERKGERRVCGRSSR
nr:hypothetical protein [Tawny frogmouth aviadenovirus A]